MIDNGEMELLKLLSALGIGQTRPATAAAAAVSGSSLGAATAPVAGGLQPAGLAAGPADGLGAAVVTPARAAPWPLWQDDVHDAEEGAAGAGHSHSYEQQAQPTAMPQAAAPAAQQQPLAAAETDGCVVCWERQKQTLLLPCKHIAMCTPCTLAVLGLQREQRTCPICRAQVCFRNARAVLCYMVKLHAGSQS